MKKILVILLAALLLCACQPTPETDAVRQKNQDAMIEMARGEDVVQNASGGEEDKELPTLDYRILYGIPEHLTEEFPGLSDKVKIVVDADINVPDQPLPIVRAVPTDFSQELVYDLWHRLVGDRKMLIDDERETKESIKAQLEYWVNVLNSPEVHDYEPGEVEQMVKDLQTRFNDAPDGEPPKEADGTLVIGELRDSHGNVIAHRTELQAYEVGGVSFNLQNSFDLKETVYESDGAYCMMNNAALTYATSDQTPHAQDSSGTLASFHLNPGDPIPEQAKAYIHSTPAEIRARADALLEQMGISDEYAVSAIELEPDADPYEHGKLIGYAYRVDCVRTVYGVPVGNEMALGMNLYWPEDMMAPAWLYENFYIWMDDSDEMRFFWSSPIETQDTVQPNCHLLPFSEIQSVMESRLPMLLNRKASQEYVKSCTALIHRIDLCLWRIREKNTVETGLLVPVYCLYMDIRYEQEYNRNEEDILIINAVDGTVIDPYNGY
ncbi:MAG: hypothetical protein IKZ44_10360 [Clostridia bacterium]|nr:hypothetical protein [Clostridia bacterium]